VQFTVDGANVGAALTSSPYQVSWNTTSAANGAHLLSAFAKDPAGNVGNAIAISVTVSNGTGLTADQDYANRCAATGVILCKQLSTAADLLDAGGSLSANGLTAGTSTTGALDPAHYRSGGASLEFTTLAACGGNCAGNWNWAMGKSFSSNSDFWIQYAMRLDGPMLTDNWGGSSYYWKQSLFFSSLGLTCDQTELTTINGYNLGFPQMYSACGANNLYGFWNGSQFNWNGGGCGSNPCTYEEDASPGAALDCVYSTFSTCAMYQANVWITYTYHVHLGTSGSANSTVEAWMTFNGGVTKRWKHLANITLNKFDTQPFDHVMLLNYITSRPGSNAGSDAHAWYDEVIVSTQPIAFPTTPATQP
jgi:hypothetical protein